MLINLNVAWHHLQRSTRLMLTLDVVPQLGDTLSFLAPDGDRRHAYAVAAVGHSDSTTGLGRYDVELVLSAEEVAIPDDATIIDWPPADRLLLEHAKQRRERRARQLSGLGAQP